MFLTTSHQRVLVPPIFFVIKTSVAPKRKQLQTEGANKSFLETQFKRSTQTSTMSLSSNSRSYQSDRPPLNIIAADLNNSSNDDDYSFRGSATGTGSGSGEHNRYSYVGNESLARMLLISRILIMALLMGLAIGCTFVTFLFTKQVEVRNFERIVSFWWCFVPMIESLQPHTHRS